jgi:hypothetical protein
MKHCLFALLILTLIITGCQKDVTFINHERPELTVDFTPFEDAGCPPDEYGRMYCEEDGPLGLLGCDLISKPSDLYGGLRPADPIARCTIEPFLDQDAGEADFPEEGTYFYNIGGLYPRFIRYVVYADGGFQLIQNVEQFQAHYAPIDSANEALSYALAVKRASAYFDLEFDPEYEYFADEIEDTHVERVDDGYLVHLFHYQVFGCGPHDTSALTYLVNESGEIERLNAEAIYKDPEEDNLCVD